MGTKTEKITTSTEKITPKVAQEYLNTMIHNRKLRRRLVERYVDSMRANQWKLTGEPIKFNTKGELIDGQHRLTAIVESEKTVEIDVRRHLHPSVFMELDTGGARSPGDLLTVAGYDYTANVASSIRQASAILEVESGVIKPTSMGKKRVAPSILLEWCEEHQEELKEAIKACISKDAKVICGPPSLFSALYFLFAQYNRKAAREFFTTLIEGIGFEHDQYDPVYMLRKQLLSFRSNKNIRRAPYYKAALVIKAWNAFQNRATIQQLKFIEGETWPEISRRRGRVSEDMAKKLRTKQERRRRLLKEAEGKRRRKASRKGRAA